MTKNQSKPSYSPIYDSSKHRNLAIEELWSVIRYRDLIFQLVRRDIVTRYKRSALGILWTMLNPLGTMIIMSIVFSQVFDMGGTYPLQPGEFPGIHHSLCIGAGLPQHRIYPG
jgi:ABC-type polysaccharide/polyol phosphate export permease